MQANKLALIAPDFLDRKHVTSMEDNLVIVEVLELIIGCFYD